MNKQSTARKTTRVEVRTTASKRERYQRAADLKGQTFTEFVEASLDQAAERVHQEFETMTLSQRDAKAFVNALLADTTPSRTLLAAAERYKARADT
jgi:uncharacterized protein (DUF1778 family)